MPTLHANGDQTFSQLELETLLHIERSAEREACAKIADASAADLVDRMQDADFDTQITGQQVLNGYLMIGKLIRNRSRVR